MIFSPIKAKSVSQISALVVIAISLVSRPPKSAAQELFVANIGESSIGEYNTTGASGATITTDVSYPQRIAISGNDLFVDNYEPSTGQSWLTEYDTTTGAEGYKISNSGIGVASLVALGNILYFYTPAAGLLNEYNASTGAAGFTINTGGISPFSLAMNSSTLYVGLNGQSTIQTYNAQTGAVGPNISTGTGQAHAMMLDGNELFVAVTNSTQSSGTVEAFNTTTRALDYTIINTGYSPQSFAISGTNIFIGWQQGFNITGEVTENNSTTGSSGFAISTTGIPASLAVTGNELFVENGTEAGNIGEYDATTGTLGFSINDQQGSPESLAIYSPASIPEPGSCSFGLMALGMAWWWRTRSTQGIRSWAK